MAAEAACGSGEQSAANQTNQARRSLEQEAELDSPTTCSPLVGITPLPSRISSFDIPAPLICAFGGWAGGVPAVSRKCSSSSEIVQQNLSGDFRAL